MFSDEIIKRLNYYVYRLIDPRSGQTFYVGKGKGNRVFSHVKGEEDAGSDALSDKLKRIREIRKDGFEVGHVIHRHGMDEKTALEVEAALIDAYPEAENKVAGHYSSERGMMHVKQIIRQYHAEETVFRHRALVIKISRSLAERDSVYEAVRRSWKLNVERAKRAEVVLAVEKGLVIGVFIPEQWREATVANFPSMEEDIPGRWGFVGSEATKEIRDMYLGTRLPDSMRKKGDANPCKYSYK